MAKKIKEVEIYRPYIKDEDRVIRKEVEKICAEYPHINKQGLEKLIFKAGLPVIRRNLEAVNVLGK